MRKKRMISGRVHTAYLKGSKIDILVLLNDIVLMFINAGIFVYICQLETQLFCCKNMIKSSYVSFR